MDVRVRDVSEVDAEGIVAILNPIIAAGEYTVLDVPLTVDFEREYIANFPPRGVFCVAEDETDGRIVGFQSVEPYATYTRAFDHVGVMGTFIDLNCRCCGIGTALAKYTFGMATRHGYEKIFTYVRADNIDSLAFHMKLGFHIVGTAYRQARIGYTYVDEVIIEKFL